MLRLGAILACLALGLSTSPALAKKKGKKKGLGPVVTRTATSAPLSPANPIASATATCPKGKRAVGGGFTGSFTMAGGIAVFASLRAGETSWTSTAMDLNGPPVPVTTHVYCRRVQKAILDVKAPAQTPPGSTAAATATSSCPGGRFRLIGGGFESDATYPNQFAIPYASMAIGRSWTYSAANNTASQNILTSHAYCAKGVTKTALVEGVTTQAAPFGGLVTASSTFCRKKRRLSAGGFAITPPSNTGPIMLLTDHRINGVSWLTTAFNGGNAGATSLTAKGICTA